MGCITNLVSKVQYENFEEGEFYNIELRSLDETLGMIQQFPWQAFRHSLFSVKLTNPSITIEQTDGSYLKVSMYYYGKFIAYFLNGVGKLSFVIVDKLEEIEIIVKRFFENRVSEIEWKKYFEWVYDKKRHFVSRSFNYTTTWKGVLRLMSVELTIFVILSLLLLLLGNVGIVEVLALVLALLWFCLPQIILLINYFIFSRKHILELSRWHNEFSFGKGNNIIKYDKENIIKIVSSSNNWFRCPWNNYYIYEINFRDGSSIKFTNLIIRSFTFDLKFPNQHIKDQHRFFPLVRINNSR